MYAHDDNFFYPNSRYIHGNLEQEKRLLVQEQKMCRARARRFSQETLRRRRALEERRKLWDVQEQRLRENVLQQRRLKVQDATERFQRAHLPPSQRHRQPCRRNVPTVEDALDHIQGRSRSDNQQFASMNRLSRSHSASPKSGAKTPPSPRPALSAMEAYIKLLQERSLNPLRSKPEVYGPKEEKPRDPSPQEDSSSDCIRSESISSKDSLDSEESKPESKYLNSLTTAFLHDTDKCPSDPKKPPAQLLSDTLMQSGKCLELKLKSQADFDSLKNKSGVSKCLWGIANNEKAPLTVGTKHYSIKSTHSSANDNLIVLNGIPHAKIKPDTPPKQESALDLRQPKASDDRQLQHPPATDILLPTKNGSSADYLFGASRPNVLLNNCSVDKSCQEEALEQAGGDNLCVFSRKDSSVSINNLNKISELDDKAVKKRLNTEFIHSACPNTGHAQEPTAPLSSEAVQRIHQVRFLKGILKKQSKYVSGVAPCVTNSGRLTLTKQVASAIRDSVELTRVKSRDLESYGADKKRLRWFDEVPLDSGDRGQETTRQIHSKSSSLLHSKDKPEDHQVSTANVSGAVRGRPGVTHTVPSGYHFTRHAWADVGVQVNLPLQHGDEVRVQQRNNKTSGPSASTKERAEAAPVSSITRKGTNTRPQSASEVSQIAGPRGRPVVPRPPPPRTQEQREPVTVAPRGPDYPPISYKPVDEPQREGLETHSPKCHETRTDNGFHFMPRPPLYANSESRGRPRPRSGLPNTQACDRRVTERRETGPCLQHTPTEEEISQLWLGVRTALATKDAQAALRRQVESVQNEQKQNAAAAAAAGVRILTHWTQPSKADPGRTFSVTPVVPGEELLRFDVAKKSEMPKFGSHYAPETSPAPRPENPPPQRHQQGVSGLSMEEARILQSLDRLNHRLHHVQEQNAGIRGILGLRKNPTTDFSAPNPPKLPAATFHPQYHRKV